MSEPDIEIQGFLVRPWDPLDDLPQLKLKTWPSNMSMKRVEELKSRRPKSAKMNKKKQRSIPFTSCVIDLTGDDEEPEGNETNNVDVMDLVDLRDEVKPVTNCESPCSFASYLSEEECEMSSRKYHSQQLKKNTNYFDHFLC
jgi:hypothetical protein